MGQRGAGMLTAARHLPWRTEDAGDAPELAAFKVPVGDFGRRQGRDDEAVVDDEAQVEQPMEAQAMLEGGDSEAFEFRRLGVGPAVHLAQARPHLVSSSLQISEARMEHFVAGVAEGEQADEGLGAEFLAGWRLVILPHLMAFDRARALATDLAKTAEPL